MIGPGGTAKGNPQYEVMGITRYWRYSKSKMQELIDTGLVLQTKLGIVPLRKQYLDMGKGGSIQSFWDDIPALSAESAERLGYPTQKLLALLEHIIQERRNIILATIFSQGPLTKTDTNGQNTSSKT